MTDLLVIGGGAAGLMAAGAACARGLTVTVLEHNPKGPGQKLLITGKGRCNVTSDSDVREFLPYVRHNGRFLYSSLYAFPPSAAMELFESLGVPLKTERGRRVFPQSDRAADVLAALRDYAESFDMKSTSLLLCGNAGLGKTHAALAIAQTVLEKGFDVVYISAQSLFGQLERDRFADDCPLMEAVLEADLLVLDDMSFNIRKGEFVCVVGPTGCGKTTFLNCLTRIHMPSEGDLYIDGVPADPRKHNISFVFQEPSALPWLTVEDNLAYGLKIKRIPKAEIDRRVNQILDLMGLQEFRKAYPGELSVSAEQRIIIGRSFAMQPDLLLMDEPYGQMDVKMRFYLEDEVIRLWKELGSTVVFITHNIEEAVYLAERVLILSNKPAKIKEEVRIDLPRPRDITSSRFIEYRNYITDKIKWW